MNSPRTDRIEQLKANLGTNRETPMTKVRIAEYEAMTDASYDLAMIAARQSSASRMASDLFRKVK